MSGNIQAVQTGAGWDVDGPMTTQALAQLDTSGNPTGQIVTPGGEVVYGLGFQPFANQFPSTNAQARKIRAAILRAASGAGLATCAVIGDSTTMGQGAAGGAYVAGGGLRASTAAFAAALRGRGLPFTNMSNFGGGGNGDIALIQPYTGTISARGTWTFQPFGGAATVSGAGCYKSNADGSLLTFDFSSVLAGGNIDTFVVYYAELPGGTSFQTQVDGGALSAAVPTNAAKAVKKLVVAAGSPGSHTLSLKGAGNSGYILGVEAYDSTKPSVRVWNWGIQGTKVGDWMGPTDGLSPQVSIPATFQPDWVHINLGINDWNTGTPIATFKAGLLALGDMCAATSGIVLESPIPTNSTAPLETQRQYVEAIAEVAAQRGWLFLDIWSAMVSYDASSAMGLMFDLNHASSAGYAAVGNLRARAIESLV